MILFVGEKPSNRAYENGWDLTSGRLAARTLYDALKHAGVEPALCRFINLFGDRPDNPETPRRRKLQEIRKASRQGVKVVALGEKVSKRLPIPHAKMRHPAARGAGRAKDVYRAHVAEILQMVAS